MHDQHPRGAWILPALLLVGAPTLAHAHDPAPSWVFFADRGRDGTELGVAIDQRAAELSPRTLERRRRARGDVGVDARDLAPAPGYVAAVLGTGARLRSTSRWLNAVSVDADATQLAAIARLPGVERLEPIVRRRRLTPAPLDRGPAQQVAAPHPSAGDDAFGVALEQLEQLDIPLLHKCGLTGAGVVVGVQDSGFSLEHAALLGIDVVAAHDFLDDDDIVADEPGDPHGQHDHGTMILSLLAGRDPGRYMGAAPGVSVILAKTEDTSVEEPFEEDRFVEGLEWVESMGADLFTTSLGYVDWYAPEDLDGATAVSTKAAAVAVEQGLIVFASIGNAGPGPTTLLAPSDADGVIAVGAVDLHGAVADFSSRGPTADGRTKPDLAAPGQAVWVADPGSPADYGRGNGTSLATPLAAGAAALLLEAFPELDPASMRALLQQSSSLADMPNDDLGWGLLDAGLPVASLCTCLDDDLDGAFAHECGGDDCNDADASIHPGALEVCNDVSDNDCNGLLDGADPVCADGSGDGEGGSNDDDGDGGGASDDAGPGGAGDSASPGDPHGDLAQDAHGCTTAGPRERGPLWPWLTGLLALGRRHRRRDGARA